MHVDRDRLCETARTELEDLRSAGVEPTDSDIVWINDLARELENEEGAILPSGTPCRAGSVWLWPFTEQAAGWYQRMVNVFDGAGRLHPFSTIGMEECVLAFALANGRTPGAFDGLDDYRTVRNAVRAWVRANAFTRRELDRAMTVVLNREPDSYTADLVSLGLAAPIAKAPSGRPDAEAMILFLCREVGGDPEYWRCSVSRDYMLHTISAACRQSQAEGQPPSDGDPIVKATRKLAQAVRYIKHRVKKSQREASDG